MRLGFGLGLQYSKLSGGGIINNAFIIEVKTDNAGDSNDNQFQFTGGQGDYDVVAKQNDIIVQTFSDLSDEATITFANGAGTYVLEVNAKATNGFTGIRFANKGDPNKLIKIIQWGIFSDTREDLFQGCLFLTDLPQINTYLNEKTNNAAIFRSCVRIILSSDITFESTTNAFAILLGCDLDSLPSGVTFQNVINGSNALRNNNLTDLPVGMTLPNLTDGTNFLRGSTINTERYSQLLVDMAAGNNNTNVSFHGGNSKYNAAGETARNLLIANQNWTIEDGGQVYQPFIIEVDTSKTGVSNADQFQFTGAEGDYDVVAKQNDIVVATFDNLSGAETITFASAGVYVLEVSAKETDGFTGLRFDNSGDKNKLIKINQWGIFSDTRENLFQGCGNLISLPINNEYLNQATNIFAIFRNCENLILPDSLTFEAAVIGTNALLFNSLTSLPPQMNLPNLQVADNMLRGNSFTDLPVGMTLPNLTDGTNFLLDSTINTERYSQLLVDMAAGNNNTNVPFHGGNSKYNDAGEVARNSLADAAGRNWSFTDGGKE